MGTRRHKPLFSRSRWKSSRTRNTRCLGELLTRTRGSIMQAKQSSSETIVMPDQIDVRLCRDLNELQACVDLQKEVWGFADTDLIPIRMFVVAQKIGGQVIGGFRGSDLIAFALAIPGNRNGHPYLHSHMLAVREQYRNSG